MAFGRWKPSTLRPVSLAGLAALLLFSAATAVASTDDSSDSRWIGSHGRAKNAIVFVHGLFGHPVGTWTAENGQTFFDYVRRSDVGPNFDIYAFGFTSNKLSSGSLDIPQASVALHERLKNERILDYDSIVFVAHSMGGLVVVDYLVHRPDVVRKVPLVALIATPQDGAEIASIADNIARNPALKQMVPIGDNSLLLALREDWRGLRINMQVSVICAYETKAIGPAVVVPRASGAGSYCTDRSVAIGNADHMSIVKPTSANAEVVAFLVNGLRTALVPRPGNRYADLRITFQPFSGLPARQPNLLFMALEEPRRRGPFAFRADQSSFLHSNFDVPVAGEVLRGTVVRDVSAAYAVTPQNNAAIQTSICMKATDTFPPREVSVVCNEARTCRLDGRAAPLVACTQPGTAGAWLHWVPLAGANAALATPLLAPGDWVIPRVETLRELRGTREGVGYSDLTLEINSPAEAAAADEVTFEARINGRRLWVLGLPSWASALPYVSSGPALIQVGIENLNASGASAGHEKLDIDVVWLADGKVVASDTVAIDFIALRDHPRTVASSRNGAEVRWRIDYFPSTRDKYQILAYGDPSGDRTASAKGKFDEARIVVRPASAALVGVVRPPKADNINWGVTVAQPQENGQLRFSFSHAEAIGICKAMLAPEARARLERKGFRNVETFGVREIAVVAGREGTMKEHRHCSQVIARGS